MNRRGFLKSIGLFVVGAAIAPKIVEPTRADSAIKIIHDDIYDPIRFERVYPYDEGAFIRATHELMDEAHRRTIQNMYRDLAVYEKSPFEATWSI